MHLLLTSHPPSASTSVTCCACRRRSRRWSCRGSSPSPADACPAWQRWRRLQLDSLLRTICCSTAPRAVHWLSDTLFLLSLLAVLAALLSGPDRLRRSALLAPASQGTILCQVCGQSSPGHPMPAWCAARLPLICPGCWLRSRCGCHACCCWQVPLSPVPPAPQPAPPHSRRRHRLCSMPHPPPRSGCQRCSPSLW